MRVARLSSFCYAFGLLFLLVFLIACQNRVVESIPSVTEKRQATPEDISENDAEIVLPPTQLATPTAVIVLAGDKDESVSDSKKSSSTVAPDPLRFSFPDSGPAPVSAWRPPLYPTPWALTPQDHFYLARPIAADEVNWPLADYRYGGIFFENEVHTGVDIPAPRETPVLAAGDGKVIWSGYGLYRGVLGDVTDPYGLAVVIRHNFGYKGKHLFSVYGHLQQIDVARGQHVVTGEILGLVGQTGKVTGPHLHFEVRVGESDFFKTYNPELWLVPPQGWGVVVMRLMSTGGLLLQEQKVFITSYENGQVWRARSYGEGAVNSDSYYQENLVVSDLPAGWYQISTSFAGRLYSFDFQIRPGRVSYISFRGRNSFNDVLPSIAGEEFTPFSSELSPNP